jgi:hypothetical protein
MAPADNEGWRGGAAIAALEHSVAATNNLKVRWCRTRGFGKQRCLSLTIMEFKVMPLAGRLAQKAIMGFVQHSFGTRRLELLYIRIYIMSWYSHHDLGKRTLSVCVRLTNAR